EEIEVVQSIHEPVVIQNGPLKIRLPEDAEALLEVHNTNSAVNCLTHTLGDLAADEVVDGQRQSEQKHLSAVLRAGSPLEDWVQRVSDLRHGGVEMSAEGTICSSACGPYRAPSASPTSTLIDLWQHYHRVGRQPISRTVIHVTDIEISQLRAPLLSAAHSRV